MKNGPSAESSQLQQTATKQRGKPSVAQNLDLCVQPCDFQTIQLILQMLLNIIWAKQNTSMGLIYLWAVTWRPLFQALTILVRKKKIHQITGNK